MKYRLFFLSFFCVLLCGAFLFLSYTVLENSQSVFSVSDRVSVSMEKGGDFILNSKGTKTDLKILPDIDSFKNNPVVSPLFRLVASSYEKIFNLIGEFLKNFS